MWYSAFPVQRQCVAHLGDQDGAEGVDRKDCLQVGGLHPRQRRLYTRSRTSCLNTGHSVEGPVETSACLPAQRIVCIPRILGEMALLSADTWGQLAGQVQHARDVDQQIQMVVLRGNPLSRRLHGRHEKSGSSCWSAGRGTLLHLVSLCVSTAMWLHVCSQVLCSLLGCTRSGVSYHLNGGLVGGVQAHDRQPFAML